MNAKRFFFGRFKLLPVALYLAVVLAAGVAAVACSTPVYRYAMYRWSPAPYTVFYFHKDEPGDADRELQALIEGYGDYTKKESANIDFVAMNLTDDPELKRLPPFLRKAWEEENDGNLPAYMIVSPLGDKMLRGSLDAEQIKAFVGSPARNEIMKFLKEGKTCVYLMLTCSDAEKNAAAEEAAKKAIKAVESGELEFYDGELPFYGAEEDADEESADEQPKKSPHSIGWIKVDRESETEHWLVRSLLTVEYDLAELDEPMIFAVFGRGRALPPYVGKGVTYDNLLDYFAEITGACSCTVKDQNPGMDLLMSNDWESVAEAMAVRFETDEGAEGALPDLFPELLVPGEDMADAEDGAAESGETDPASVETSETGVAAPDATGETTTADSSAESTAGGASQVPDEDGETAEPSGGAAEPAGGDESVAGKDESEIPPTVASDSGGAAAGTTPDKPAPAARDAGSPAKTEATEIAATSGTDRLMVTMGIGLGIAVVVLLLATFLLGRGGR